MRFLSRVRTAVLEAEDGTFGGESSSFGKVKGLRNFGSLGDVIVRALSPEEELREKENLDFQLDKMLNGGLDLQDNFQGAMLELETTGKKQKVRHGLGFKPSGFIVIWKDGPGDIYADGVTEWTTEILYLNADVSNRKVRLFVL